MARISERLRVSRKIGAIAESATLAVDAKAKALKAAGEHVISFGAGEPDFPTPPHIVEAAVEACRDPSSHKYTPAAGLPELREAIAAKTARDKLKIAWEGGAKVSSAALAAQYKELAKTPGKVARKDGDAAAAHDKAAKKFAATYAFPFLAHAPMEPLNAVIHAKKDGAEIWAGSQFQTFDQAIPARVLGLKPEQVKLNTLFAGGSFGRRATPTADYMAEAAAVAKAAMAAGIAAPLRVMWSREDDIKGGYYRPFYVHTLAAGLDDTGAIASWQHRIVGQSILAGTPFAGMIKDGVDATSVEGAANLPYAIPNLTVDLHTTDPGIPILWWRAVGSTQEEGRVWQQRQEEPADCEHGHWPEWAPVGERDHDDQEPE